MIDVVHSVSLDCPQYFPTPTGTFPATTPTSLHSSVQQHIDFNSASLGDFDLTGEQLIARLNLLDPASLFAMAFQPTQLFHLSGLSGQEDSQSSESTPSSHTEIYDSAMLQSNMTPSFVEPSTNYFALPATSAPTYYNGYNNNNSSSLTTLPTSSAMALTGATSTNNLSSVSSRTNPGYVENYPAPQPHHGHHGHHHHHHHLEHNPHASRVGMSNPQLIVPPSHHYYQREVYQGSVPSSIGRISRQHNPVQNHHPKPISVSIGTGHSSHRQPNNLAAAIASPIFVAPTYNINNINSGGNNTMHLPLFESNNSGSPSAINNSTAAQSPETTTKTTPTYSYSGPPKSYYSRLPLYDRPFKCDQCPQSFNRNHDLKRHKRIHLAVKPYPCPCCEKQFSRKDALKRHILVKGCTKKVTPTTTSNKVADKSSIEKYDPSPIESYVDTISQPKTEPTEYGMSI